MTESYGDLETLCGIASLLEEEKTKSIFERWQKEENGGVLRKSATGRGRSINNCTSNEATGWWALRAYSYYGVRLDTGKNKRGGWKEGAKITEGMCHADEPEYYSVHNKEPQKSFP